MYQVNDTLNHFYKVCFWYQKESPGGVLESLFWKGYRPQASNFIKIETSMQVFPVNFVKFLRTAFFREYLWYVQYVLATMKICWKWTYFFIYSKASCLSKKVSTVDAGILSLQPDFQWKNIARVSKILGAMAKVSFSVMQHALFFS